MEETKTETPGAPPIRWSCGVTAHNESAAGRLRPWLEHWRQIVANPADIVLILHDCDDDSAAVATEYGVTAVEVGIRGLMESILWEPPIYAHPDSWFWRLGGADETVSAECIARAAVVIEANPAVRLYRVSRRNYCEGVDISDLLGPDWQVALFRPAPPPILFRGGAHQYPEITVPAPLQGLMVPDICWIDHHRTYDEVVRQNTSRAGYMSPQYVEMQERFCKALEERMKGART